MAALLALGLAVLGLAVPSTAAADTRPATGTPVTVAADALGTVQVNGVVWSMVTVGNTVYATGSFTHARPSGAAPGVSQTARANLLAFDIRTGALISSFNHRLNGQGRIIVASPDKRRVYVGGDFTTVDGLARGHLAAFDVATGALVPGFAPTVNAGVYSIAATAGTVYAGGRFTTANGQSRTRLAAFSATNGSLTGWAPSANHTVRGIVLDPTGTRVVLAGNFSRVNEVEAYAVASVDTTGADTRTWGYGIDNSGDPAGAFSLKTDGVNAYASVYGYQAGNVEGVVAFDPTTLELVWMNDCHGDPYDTWSNGTVLYNASHAHDCETSGSFPDPEPRDWKRATAMTVAPTGTLKPTTDVPRYTSWTGRPHPTILHFWPNVPAGTYTGQFQGAWSVTGGGDHVVFGGEFTSVNGRAQQGLVRFATTTVAPNDRGPEVTAQGMQPTATSTTAGSVTVTWPSSFDMDNEVLTYRVFRNGGTTPVHTVTASSAWWRRPLLRFVDTAPPGSSVSYRVSATDAFGNAVTSAQSNTLRVATTTSDYANTVLADGPDQYWRLGEPSGSTAYDHVGTTHLTTSSGITRGTAGAVAGDTAVTASGTATGQATTAAAVAAGTDAFSVEAWVRTTSAAGGVIAQYGEDLPPADVANTDRALYVDAGGRVSFGLSARGEDRVTRYTTVRSAAPVTDGQWHHLVATVGSGGTTLYVDGVEVARNATMTAPNSRVSPGHWLLGNGRLTGAPQAPSRTSLAGAIDEVAVYSSGLSATEVAEHFAVARGAAPPPPPPPPPPVNEAPRAVLATVVSDLAVSVDAAGSSDEDGTVSSYAWSWGDGSPAGSGATASHTYAAAGTYLVRLTVTDDDGATATAERSVTVTAPVEEEPPGGGEPPAGRVVAADAFDRSGTGGLGTADVGGAWTVSAGPTRQSVSAGAALLELPAGKNTGSYLTGVSETDVDLRTTVSLSQVPVVGSGVYLYVTGRRVAANQEYQARLRLRTDGRVEVALTRLAGSADAVVLGSAVTLPGFTYTAGTPLELRLQVTGRGSTQLAATVWPAGATEPATPTVTATDSTASLQAPGGVGLLGYQSSTATATVSLRIAELTVRTGA